jgi:hypothetical protein
LYPDAQLAAEHAARSALHGRLIFVVASPESGAHLVVRALGGLPGVTAAPIATNLFSTGFDRMLDTWMASDPGERLGGLIDLVDAQDFLWSARRLADGLLAPLIEDDPDAFIVEYSPDHIRSVLAIATLYPDAYLLHVVRDGGEVAARLASPHRDLYRPLQAAPVPQEHVWRLARAAAQQWSDEQRAVEDFADSPTYLVARIERILADPTAFLAWLAQRVGLETDGEALDRGAATIGGGRWRLTKPPAARAQVLVNALAPDLLDKYEYEPTEISEVRALLGRAELGYERFTERTRHAMLGLAARLQALSVKWDADAKEPE